MILNYQDAPTYSPEQLMVLKSANTTVISKHYPDIKLQHVNNTNMGIIWLDANHTTRPMPIDEARCMFLRLFDKPKVRDAKPVIEHKPLDKEQSAELKKQLAAKFYALGCRNDLNQ